MKAIIFITTLIALSLYTNQFESLILSKDTGASLNGDLGHVFVVQTSKGNNDRLAEKDAVEFTEDFEFAGPTIDVTSGKLDQVIEGFGGAFTEAAAGTFFSLTKDKQDKLIEAYFDSKNGIGYTIGRVPVGACDFSPEEASKWSYADVEGDVNLEHFDTNATMDKKNVIPMVQLAAKKIKEAGQGVFKLFGSPWSPPAWMKTNGQMHGSGPGGNGGKLQKKYWSVMADYLVKWVSVWKDLGIPIWALTPQNEPEGPWEFETCLYGPYEEAAWIAKHLGPKLEEAHPEVLIFPFDHNKNNVFEWTQAMYDHPEAAKYVDGMAFHWYSGDDFDKVAESHKKAPGAILLNTEATWESKNYPPEFNYIDGAWNLGEGYGHDVMGDLNAGANGWTDWNLMLDIRGGPNHINNFCDAPVIGHNDQLFFHSQYYYLGHFSKYLVQGSKRVEHKVLNSTKYTGKRRNYGNCTAEDGLDATAWKRPDGKMAIVVLNCDEKAQEFKLLENGKSAKLTIPGNSIQTLLY